MGDELARARADLARSRELLRGVQDAPAERVRLLLDNIRPTVGQVVMLLDDVRDASPNKAVKLGRLALQQARRLDHEALVVEALAELGNALRRRGDLRSAGRALGTARRLSLFAGLDPLAEARLHSVLASLKNQLREFRRAIGHARRALRLYREVEQQRDAIVTTILLSYLLTEAGTPERALPVAEEAWNEALAVEDARLALQALHNRIYALVEMDRFHQALQLLAAGASTYRTLGTPRERTLATWLEARCRFGCGEYVRSAEMLERVCAELAEQELGYEYVTAGLQLALAYHGAGWSTATRSLCSDLVPLAETVGVDDAALLALRIAVDADNVTAAALERLLGVVRGAPRQDRSSS
jgi:tetratricopeptide (TPR) repeat protein